MDRKRKQYPCTRKRKLKSNVELMKRNKRAKQLQTKSSARDEPRNDAVADKTCRSTEQPEWHNECTSMIKLEAVAFNNPGNEENLQFLDTMNLDTVELINEIMIRPEIWMSKHPANKNKWKTLRKWEDMKNAKFPVYTVDDLKKRWKNIKDQYRKELKKLPPSRPGVPFENITSSWKYFEYMTFLKDELVVNKDAAEPETLDMEQEALGEGSSCASQEYRMLEVSEIKPEPTESPQHSMKSDDETEPAAASIPIHIRPRSNQPPKEMREELLKIEQRKLQILEAEIAKSSAHMKSDNYQFLMSILPEMEKLPSVHKMRLRTKISQAVLDEVTSYERDRFNNISLTQMQDSTLNNIPVEIKEEPINMYD